MTKKATAMRDFFVLALDDRDDLRSVSDYEMGDFDLTAFWHGKPFLGTIPKDVKVFVDNGASPDYMGNPLSWPICSDRLLRIIIPIAGKYVQCFPAPLYDENDLKPITGYTIINVTRRINALGQKRGSTGKVVLEEANIPPDAHLFRVVGRETKLIVSQEFLAAIRGKELQGLALIKTKCV